MKNTYVIVGDNQKNATIADSIKDGNLVFIVDTSRRVEFFKFPHNTIFEEIIENDLSRTLKKLVNSCDNKKITVVINTEDKDKDLLFGKQLIDIVGLSEADNSIGESFEIFGYILTDLADSNAKAELFEKTGGRVSYADKSTMTAMAFVDKYPITQFMTTNEIDYLSATVKNDVDINVLLLGFGGVNRNIFFTSVCNNQLMTRKEGKPVEKLVNYWIYSKESEEECQSICKDYYKYTSILKEDMNMYLPLPPRPANETFLPFEIEKNEFYHSLEAILCGNRGKRPYNYIVIDLGSDAENLDIARTLTKNLKKWNLTSQTKVFAYAKERVCQEAEFEIFGNEKETIYDISKITNEKWGLMALDRHLCYSLGGISTTDDCEAQKEKALKRWFAQSQVQRESNIFACLSIRMKLHLLGFDYAPISDHRACANTLFSDAYQRDDKIDYDEKMSCGFGKKAIKYSNNMPVGTIRQNFAIQEHQRWNAYMICNGFIPSTIEQIVAGENKNMQLKRHSNVASFEGLKEYRKLWAQIKSISEEDADVIRYDYQLMDDLVWMLTHSGYKIVKKT